MVDTDNYMAQVTQSLTREDELEARLEATKGQLRDLATMGAVITSIQEIDAVLSVVMDMAIRLVNGEVGLIMLENKGELTTNVTWGLDEQFARRLIVDGETDLPTHCFSNRVPVLLNSLSMRDRAGILIDSVICLPIQMSDKCFGILMIVNKSTGGDFTTEDRDVLQMFLSFVAVAIHNSHLVNEKLQQQKTAQELAIARQVQKTILPQDIDTIPRAEIGAVYYPAGEVGGDFYDVLKIDQDSFMVLIGDVSNKGVPAALVMSASAGIVKSILSIDPAVNVSQLTQLLNERLCEGIIRDREMFVTLFLAKLDLKNMTLTYCNAGHIPGLLWNNRLKRIFELPEGGPIVGQFPGTVFKQGQRAIGSADRLFLFTDGLTEARDTADNLFGRERAERVFRAEIELPPKAFCAKVKQWVDNFTKGADEDAVDDFTVLQVKVD